MSPPKSSISWRMGRELVAFLGTKYCNFWEIPHCTNVATYMLWLALTHHIFHIAHHLSIWIALKHVQPISARRQMHRLFFQAGQNVENFSTQPLSRGLQYKSRSWAGEGWLQPLVALTVTNRWSQLQGTTVLYKIHVSLKGLYLIPYINTYYLIYVVQYPSYHLFHPLFFKHFIKSPPSRRLEFRNLRL